MTFLERYNNESNQELFAIVDTPNDYVEECLAIVHQIFKKRKFNPAELKEMDKRNFI